MVNYRTGSGGRSALNKRVTLGRFGRITPEQARRMAQELRYHADISKAAGTRFWFHGLRNAFITVAERDLMLPPAPHQAPREPRPRRRHHRGHAADWTIEQLREPAQRVADRIEAVMKC